jgi:hypothetical protein
MKLIRFDDDKTGLVVELSSGPHVVDVVASIGALVPEDPISHGLLNGLLKDKGSWAPLIQHWKMARSGLRRLGILAQTVGSSQIVLRQLDEICISPGQLDRINSLEIGELNAISQDPTNREVLERQFTETPSDPTGREPITSQFFDEPAVAVPSADRVIVLSDVRATR